MARPGFDCDQYSFVSGPGLPDRLRLSDRLRFICLAAAQCTLITGLDLRLRKPGDCHICGNMAGSREPKFKHGGGSAGHHWFSGVDQYIQTDQNRSGGKECTFTGCKIERGAMSIKIQLKK